MAAIIHSNQPKSATKTLQGHVTLNAHLDYTLTL